MEISIVFRSFMAEDIVKALGSHLQRTLVGLAIWAFGFAWLALHRFLLLVGRGLDKGRSLTVCKYLIAPAER